MDEKNSVSSVVASLLEEASIKIHEQLEEVSAVLNEKDRQIEKLEAENGRLSGLLEKMTGEVHATAVELLKFIGEEDAEEDMEACEEPGDGGEAGPFQESEDEPDKLDESENPGAGNAEEYTEGSDETSTAEEDAEEKQEENCIELEDEDYAGTAADEEHAGGIWSTEPEESPEEGQETVAVAENPEPEEIPGETESSTAEEISTDVPEEEGTEEIEVPSEISSELESLMDRMKWDEDNEDAKTGDGQDSEVDRLLNSIKENEANASAAADTTPDDMGEEPGPEDIDMSIDDILGSMDFGDDSRKSLAHRKKTDDGKSRAEAFAEFAGSHEGTGNVFEEYFSKNKK